VRLLWNNHTLLKENFSESFRRIEMVEPGGFEPPTF
jgi:hypothetical protein